MPKSGSSYTLATALPSLLVQLQHTAGHGTRINESLSCLESTGVTVQSRLWASATSGSRARHRAPGSEPLGAQTCSSRCHCPGGLRFAHTHTLPSFSLKRGKSRKAGFKKRVGGVSSVFPLRFLLQSQGGPQSVARSPAVAPSSTLLSLEGLEPVGLRVLSHLPCHDCSVNHLEPSFTRQGSVELIAHQTVKMVISVS